MARSELSVESRARRDAILEEIRKHGGPVDDVQRQLEEEAPRLVLERSEADNWVRMPADVLHYRADRVVWLSYFPDRGEEFDRLPKPSTAGPSCPEYEPYRARVRERKKAKEVQAIGNIPSDLWQTTGFLGAESLGITEWCITLPAAFTPIDELVPGVVDGAVAPWADSPLVVCVELGSGWTLTLRWRVAEDTPRAREMAREAWMDLVGWYYDLMAGNRAPLPAWTAKAAETRGQAVQRDASSLRRLAEVEALDKKYSDAVALLHSQGVLAADRETGGYPAETVANNLESWWVQDLRDKVPLGEDRRRHIGWWAWHCEATKPLGRAKPGEVEELMQLYMQRRVAEPVIESAVRRLLDASFGPFGSVAQTLTAIEGWVNTNPDRLLLSPAHLGCMSIIALHRLAPGSQEVVQYYLATALPAAADEFLSGLVGSPEAVPRAVFHWLDANPDGHLGSVGERAKVLFDVRARRAQHGLSL